MNRLNFKLVFDRQQTFPIDDARNNVPKGISVHFKSSQIER